MFFILIYNLSFSQWKIHSVKDDFEKKTTISYISVKNKNKGTTEFKAENKVQWIMTFKNLGFRFPGFSYVRGHNNYTIKAKIDNGETYNFRGVAWDNLSSLYLYPRNELDIKFIKELINGNTLKVGIIQKNESKIVFDVPLSGFSNAYNQLPLTLEKLIIPKKKEFAKLSMLKLSLPVEYTDYYLFKNPGNEKQIAKKYKVDYKTVLEWKKIFRDYDKLEKELKKYE
ncbi:MAG: invasion associated locus B family protein [Cetobacterium sp.]